MTQHGYFSVSGANMKTFLAFLFLIWASSSFAQSGATATTASAPGCGTANTKFEVQSSKSQHPFAKPDPGKALIYFLQDDTYFLSRPRPTTRFGLDGNWVGATQSNAYFYLTIDPGEHHLCAGWQSFVAVDAAQKSAAAHFSAEPGGIYFFIVRDHWNEKLGPAGMKFEALDSDEAQLLMSKFAFSTSRARK
jgi:hypothetical protein